MESHCWLRTCRGILYSTHLYCQWEPQPKVLHLQLEGYGQQNLYTQHSILLSQQANPSRLEMRTVWISNLIIRIFFWEAEDASLKHLWVWRSPGFWASGLAIHGHIHILLQFQFQAKPAPFYPWEACKGLRWLIQWVTCTTFQHPTSEDRTSLQFREWTASALHHAQGIFSWPKEETSKHDLKYSCGLQWKSNKESLFGIWLRCFLPL